MTVRKHIFDEQLGLTHMLTGLPAKDSVETIYNAFDFATSSASCGEGCSNENIIGEAMAFGLPAVSFDCGSDPRDSIRHEVAGWYTSEDVYSLAAALSRLTGDDDLRRRFDSRAVAARQQFSLEGIAVRWEILFEAALIK